MAYKVLFWKKDRNIQQSFPAEIRIQLPKSAVKIYGLQLRPESIIYINNILGDYFAIQLAFWVQMQTKADGRYKGFNPAIHDFCRMHDIIIDEDISLDALKKMEFRKRNSFKKKLAK